MVDGNTAIYRYAEIADARLNIISISCDDMLSYNDKLANASCKSRPNEKCDTGNILRGTFNYKGYDVNRSFTWKTIERPVSVGAFSTAEPRCVLYNYSVDDKLKISKNTNTNSVSGVLTDRQKYIGSKIRQRTYYDTSNDKGPNVNIKEIGNRFLVTS